MFFNAFGPYRRCTDDSDVSEICSSDITAKERVPSGALGNWWTGEEHTLTLPSSIMKMSRPHRVYLSRQAEDILGGV